MGLKLKMRIRKEILDDNLKRPKRFADSERHVERLWLDKNECIDSKMNQVVLNSLSRIQPQSVFSYPDLNILYSKISKMTNMKSSNILLAAGSDGAIRACFETCVVPGDKVILLRPTFAMYEVYSRIYGAEVIWLDYHPSEDGPYMDAETVIEAIISYKPKMVCLPNPNSPTGTIFSPDKLHAMVDAGNQCGVMVLIDEAYYPLYKWTAASWVNKFDNLVVVRSFSKAWGAAGLRVGYAIANQELISLIYKQRPMYEIGNVSAKAIEILLDHEEDMQSSVARVNAGKKYFQDAMRKIGFLTYESYGNFFHVKFGMHADNIHLALNDKVYYRKNFSEPCLVGYSRFSATTIEKIEPIVFLIMDAIGSKKIKC